MAASFYDLSVASFLQTVSAVAGFLDRAVQPLRRDRRRP